MIEGVNYSAEPAVSLRAHAEGHSELSSILRRGSIERTLTTICHP